MISHHTVSTNRTSNPTIKLYNYADTKRGHRLTISSIAPNQSGHFSLGGNRIVPLCLATAPGFDLDEMALQLAEQMQTKINMMRYLNMDQGSRVDLEHFHGGKCVGLPAEGSRLGEPGYSEFLKFQVECFEDFEKRTGNFLITGQDLGHGRIDKENTSLSLMQRLHPGVVDIDTSVATAHGVFALFNGLARGILPSLDSIQIGLVGAGKIGRKLIELFSNRQQISNIFLMEPDEMNVRLAQTSKVGATFFPQENKKFFDLPLDGILANANGGTFSSIAVEQIIRNPKIRILSGAENLAMQNPRHESTLRSNGKLYAPTETAGLMGAMAAALQYFATRDNWQLTEVKLEEMANQLEIAGFEASRLAMSNQNMLFDEAIKERFHEKG